MQNLHALSLQQPVMTPEAFLAQVAWPGGQCPSVRRGDTFGVAEDDYVAYIRDAHRAWDPGPTQD